jgi:hypothetical protein
MRAYLFESSMEKKSGFQALENILFAPLSSWYVLEYISSSKVK